jgi:hypothetical protein
MKSGKGLRPVQLSAIRLLAVGTPIVKVAERLDVSCMTIWRWRTQNPEFESRLNAVAASGLQEVGKQINRTALAAIEVLQGLLGDMTQPTSVQIKVALGVLNSMPSVNAAIDKALLHRAADFDPEQRWDNQVGQTYDQCEPCNASGDTVTV